MIMSEKQTKHIKQQQQQHRFHTRQHFPGKNDNPSFAIEASFNKSIIKCGHRLSRALSKFVRVLTPSCRAKSIKILRKKEKSQLVNDDVEPSCGHQPPLVLVVQPNLLPPLGSHKKGTIVLDLDETLVHSSLNPSPPRYDFTVSRVMDGVTIYFYVFKRPGVDEFLEFISKKYEVVVFTAGHKAYASQVLDTLDPKGYISHRFYRDSCKQVKGKFIKDLSEMGRDLSKTVVVDDNPKSFSLQPENGIRIKPFYGDELWDRELMRLAGFFERCDMFQDMRNAVNQYNIVCSKQLV